MAFDKTRSAGFLANHMARLFTKGLQQEIRPLGLAPAQFMTLLALWEKGSLRVSDIGAKLYLDSGTLTPLLKKLEVMGFVTRIRSSVDERQVMVELTQQGKELQAKSSRVPACVLQASGCELPEVWQMNHQLKALRANLVAAHI